MIKKTLSVFFGMTVMAASLSHANEEAPGVYFSIDLNEAETAYTISAIPTTTPDGDINLSGQVTLKVPHASEAGYDFKINELTSHVDGYIWIETSRINSPKESPDFDFISLSFVPSEKSYYPFGWEKNQEKQLFSFSHAGQCLGNIELLDKNDPFNIPLNSANTNPGNQFTNLGWGNININQYLGNEKNAVECMSGN